MIHIKKGHKILPDFELKNLYQMATEYLISIKYIEEKQQFGLELTIFFMTKSSQLQSEMKLYGIDIDLMYFARLTQFTDYDKMQEIFSLIPQIKDSIYRYLSILESKNKIKETKHRINFKFEDYFNPTKKTLKAIIIRKIYNFIVDSPSVYSPKSRSITDQRKFTVRKRDKCICQLCNNEFPEEDLEIDHIYPFSLGGSNEVYNLMCVCRNCNLNKGKKVEYFRNEEGKEKILQNIEKFVEDLPIINDFGKWLKNRGDRRGKN